MSSSSEAFVRLSIRWMLCAAMLAASVFILYGQTDLTGFWVFRVPRNDGTFQESFIELKQEGEQITGKISPGNRQISEGGFKDGRLHFVVSFQRGNNPAVQIPYDGKPSEGGKFSLTTTPPG